MKDTTDSKGHWNNNKRILQIILFLKNWKLRWNGPILEKTANQFIQEETDNLKRPIAAKKYESIIKTLPK